MHKRRWRSYAEWLRDNPPPDLQAIINEFGRSEVEIMQDGQLRKFYGGFSDVPPEVWADFTRKMINWQMRRKYRHLED
jgi:hypothetical protein